MAKKALIIDDDIDLCLLLSRFLNKNGFETTTAHSGAKGIALYDPANFDVVIADYRLDDMDGIKLIKGLKAKDPQVSILVITGYSDIKTAVEVIKLGAFDYITKPLIPDEVLSILNNLLAKKENKQQTLQVSETGHHDKKRAALNFYKGKSPASVFLHEQADIIARTNYSVLLYGESGTGKEVIASLIHDMSERSHKPFIALDCGTLSRELAGSELFGHVKGSFTGAIQDKEGHFELAEGGTLFLDEVGNLSSGVQAALLRVIQERKFKRVGGNKEIPTDVRIIVASNENLAEAYRKGKFREDLYHRLNEFSIHLPPLRERREDIVPLAEFFLEQSNKETKKNISGFNDDVLNIFMEYTWPGNLREFRNVVRRAVLLTPSDSKISSTSLPQEIVHHTPVHHIASPFEPQIPHFEGFGPAETIPGKDPLKGAASRAEFYTIMSVMQQVNFNKKKAAELLKIDRKTLYNKLKSFQASQQQ
jgi:two-component system, NtrC family, response regulator HydG